MSYSNETIISVIVPVFNVECFLEECVSSILNQTIHNLQVILVDDGSTDSSGKICDQFVDNDKRIIVIHQSNSGVSAARNAGLRVAKGKYISFVDSDDVLPLNAYEKLLNSQIENNELVIGRMQRLSESGDLLELTGKFNTSEVRKDIFLEELFEEKEYPYLGFMCDKLFLRHVIEKNDILFDQAIKVNEDRLFILQYMLHVEKVRLTNNVVYFYRQRSNGVITSTRSNVTVTDSEMTVLKSFQKMQKICKSNSEELYFICCRKAFECALDLLNRVSKKDKRKKKILKNFLLENSYMCLSNPQYGFSEKIKIVAHTILKK